MRLGIDVGGTKIEALALGGDGAGLWRQRVETPQGDYEATIDSIVGLVTRCESELGKKGTVGVAIPGTISAVSGLVKNANSTCLIGRTLDVDLERRLDRPVRVANDANCFALSEAADGAGSGAQVVFGVILGTGVGGGLCVGGKTIIGAHAIAGEWGHNPLPARSVTELPGPPCYCGKTGCIETWLSGPAVARQYAQAGGAAAAPAEIAARWASGETLAAAVMEAWLDRCARSLAGVANILDPDAFVLGGGLSNIDALYAELPARIQKYAFTAEEPFVVRKNRHGDSSGVRGAAWLWDIGEFAAGRRR